MKRTIKALSLTLILSLIISNTPAFGGWFSEDAESTIVEKGLSLVKSPYTVAATLAVACGTVLAAYAIFGKKTEVKPGEAKKTDVKPGLLSKIKNWFSSNKKNEKKITPVVVEKPKTEPTKTVQTNNNNCQTGKCLLPTTSKKGCQNCKNRNNRCSKTQPVSPKGGANN